MIQAQRNRPKRNAAGNPTQDPEAGHNTKVGSDGTLKRTYGYKAHINVDEDGFIKATELTPGNVHDSRCFTELLSGDESMVFADSAYASRATDQWLKRRGCSGQAFLAIVLCIRQNLFSDSFGVKPPAAVCGLT